MPGTHLSPDQKKAIADDIRDTAGSTDGSVRKIATRHGVGMGTVRKIAAAVGLEHAWRDGAHRTEAANVQKAAHLAERRAQLQVDLLDDVEEIRERLFSQVTHLHVVKVDPTQDEVQHTELPAGPRDWRDAMGAIAAATGQAIALARLESENSGSGEASHLLGKFFGALRDEARDQDPAPE